METRGPSFFTRAAAAQECFPHMPGAPHPIIAIPPTLRRPPSTSTTQPTPTESWRLTILALPSSVCSRNFQSGRNFGN
eukprot:5669283-Amphidinium_carterae.1